jgi:hypothetical protein
MNDFPKTHKIPLLDAANDGRHKLRDLALERESIPYVISLPEHGIATFVYTWVTKDHVAGCAFLVFGPSIGEQPIMEMIDGIAVSPEQNFDNWQVGPLHLQQDLKLKAAKIVARGQRVELDASFEALHPAYAYGFHPDGCPTWAATDRLEQAGRIKGTLRIDGKAYPVDTTCARDHSWGTRNWDAPQHWKWLHAQSGNDLCVHFWKIEARGRTELRGYLFRDGEMAEVESVDIDWTHDQKYDQKTINAVVRDRAGRTARVTGTYFAHFPMRPVPTCTLVEGAMRCEIDGKPGVGWTEVMWPTSYLELLKTGA